MGTSELCIGVDANVQLAPRLKKAVGAHTAGPPIGDRARIFAELAGALQLLAVNIATVRDPHDFLYVPINLGMGLSLHK